MDISDTPNLLDKAFSRERLFIRLRTVWTSENNQIAVIETFDSMNRIGASTGV